jgi:hypothetical protein
MSYGPDIRCEWSAWYNRMPGAGDTDLHVVGRCRLPSGSIKVTLEPGNVGTVPDPSLFALQATVEVPEVGTGDWVEREVPWQGDAGQDVKTVRIQGDLQAEVPVTIAS